MGPSSGWTGCIFFWWLFVLCAIENVNGYNKHDNLQSAALRSGESDVDGEEDKMLKSLYDEFKSSNALRDDDDFEIAMAKVHNPLINRYLKLGKRHKRGKRGRGRKRRIKKRRRRKRKRKRKRRGTPRRRRRRRKRGR